MTRYTVERSTSVHAPTERLHGLVNDLHQWTTWSPWEGLDSDMQRTYAGPEAGPGATYSWSGNRKVGRGQMAITSSTPEAIALRLEYLKPFPSTSAVVFTFRPTPTGTDVTWRLTGEQSGVMAFFGRFVRMDKLMGPAFEKGLARLKAVAEGTG